MKIKLKKLVYLALPVLKRVALSSESIFNLSVEWWR